MKRVAGTQQATIVVEVVVEPIEVQVPALTIPVEVWNVPVAVAVAPLCVRAPSKPPSFEYSRDCIEFGIFNPLVLYTEYLHF